MSSIWGWLEQAQSQAKELATQAQETAINLSKQAVELQQSYDYQVASSILMNGLGATHPMSTSDNKLDSNSIKKTKLKKNNNNNNIDISLVTENILSMSFPYDLTNPKSPANGNDIDAVSDFFQKKHKGHFMIWNVSEEPYDYSKFENQVLEYKFPGHPAPPLGLIFKICTSVESWLDADIKNIAVIHCLTGKGRTAVIIAAILTWIGEFSSPMEALQYISDRRNIPIDILTIPSQRRYVQYFTNVLDGVKPCFDSLLLRRIIMNGIPMFGNRDGLTTPLNGCCPYIQLFKNGRLIGTASIASDVDTSLYNVSSSTLGKSGNVSQPVEARWILDIEGTASFHIDCILQGDILIRCRHLDSHNKSRISMFRAGFHTGYIHSGVLRLTKSQLDGPNTDDRFPDDFFIDLIFASVDTTSNNNSNIMGLSDAGITSDVPNDLCEQMLQKDVRFWESVTQRKIKAKKRKSRKFLSATSDKFSISDDDKPSNLSEPQYIEEVVNSYYESNSDHDATKKQSDLDLIQQLTLAENDNDFDMILQSTANDKINSNVSNMTTEHNKMDTNDQLGVDSRSLVKSTKENNPSASLELKALEDLEKELGLDMGSIESVKTSTVVDTSKAVSSVDDLEDLEKFLESLSASS